MELGIPKFLNFSALKSLKYTVSPSKIEESPYLHLMPNSGELNYLREFSQPSEGVLHDTG